MKKYTNDLINETFSYLLQYVEKPVNWAILLNHFIYGLNEFVIIGKNAEEKYNQIKNRKNAISLFACSISELKLLIFENKSLQDEAFIYLCKNNSCLISTKKVEDVC